ncbi:hypothetical protein [Bacillus sp. FJAT-22090]|uniref:hypothetical protein n=1 Tax=Bacillus sp. FJAT-22090 TaxID=1581038 RepID=UPI0011A13627|nr:hypothetical protein [Bacillus sp. FJAT-22090]
MIFDFINMDYFVFEIYISLPTKCVKYDLFRTLDYRTALWELTCILDCSKAIEHNLKRGKLDESFCFVRDIDMKIKVSGWIALEPVVRYFLIEKEQLKS